MGRMGRAVMLAFALNTASGASLAASCYEPSFDAARAVKITFADGATVPMEVRPARENSSDVSLLVVKGSAAQSLCVSIGPRVRNVQYPIQSEPRIEAVALAEADVIMVSGRYSGGSDCCQLVQFLRVDPMTGVVTGNSRGGFVLPNLARLRYGFTKSGALRVFTAIRVMSADAHTEGTHRFLLARYSYAPSTGKLTKVAEHLSQREYDLATGALDIFASEGIAIDSRPLGVPQPRLPRP